MNKATTYVRINDMRGRLPYDPRVISAEGYYTIRYGWVATGWLVVNDIIEVDTGRPDTRQWIAPNGKLYTYNIGLTPGDPHTFEVYTPAGSDQGEF